MKKIVSLVISGIIFFTACTNESGGEKFSKISGYKYIVLKAGSGEKPNVNDFVYFQMDIKDDQDKVLQSYRNQKIAPSVQILAEDNPARRSNPIVDILSFSSVGDSISVIVPKDSVPGLPPGFDDLKYLQYVVTVTDVLTEDENQEKVQADQTAQYAEMEKAQARQDEVAEFTSKALADLNSGNLKMEKTDNNVQYFIHELGGGELPTADRMVTVHYYGRYEKSGEMFDNSFGKGMPYTFRVGRREVIPGWDDVIQYLPVGSKASVLIPYEMAYGEAGGQGVPPKSNLYFYMEVEEMFY